MADANGVLSAVFDPVNNALRVSDSGTSVPKTDTQVTTVEKRVWEVQAAGTGKGKFVVSVLDNIYTLIPDPTMYVGYNLTAGGARILAGENGLAFGIEADYNDGSGHNKMETYTQYVASSGPTYKRLSFWQIQRDTDAITNCTIMGSLTSGVALTCDDGTAQGGIVFNAIKNANRCKAIGADNHLYIEGATGTAALLDLGYNGLDSVVVLRTFTASIGRLAVAGGGGSGVIYFSSLVNSASGSNLSIGVQDSTANFVVKGTGALTNPTAIFHPQASQTGDLVQLKNTAGAVKTAVLPGGVLISDDATLGLILKDAAGTPHYWRVTVSTGGVLTTADLGTTRPTA